MGIVRGKQGESLPPAFPLPSSCLPLANIASGTGFRVADESKS